MPPAKRPPSGPPPPPPRAPPPPPPPPPAGAGLDSVHFQKETTNFSHPSYLGSSKGMVLVIGALLSFVTAFLRPFLEKPSIEPSKAERPSVFGGALKAGAGGGGGGGPDILYTYCQGGTKKTIV